MQSEYPDTVWAGLPRWYSEGRDGKTPTLSVIHYTAGSESRSSAENGAAYDKIRPSQVSCHCFHDPDSSVQELPRAFRAYSAFAKGNRLGIHHELCGTAQTRAQWLDEASDAILTRAARAVAQDCKDYGLEPRLLTVAEVRASWYSYPTGPRGICGHVHITKAFPEDGGDHTDPGPDFPWDVFIARVNSFLTPAAASGSPRKARRMTEYVWMLPGGKAYAVERPYHPDPSKRWEELPTYDEAVGVALANANATKLEQAAWDRRKAAALRGTPA